jgi:hypothetical protein
MLQNKGIVHQVGNWNKLYYDARSEKHPIVAKHYANCVILYPSITQTSSNSLIRSPLIQVSLSYTTRLKLLGTTTPCADYHHHHHVHEGLGMFHVPWSSKWSWSLHLFFGRPTFLRPFGLYCSACFGSLFVSILCTCCSHFCVLIMRYLNGGCGVARFFAPVAASNRNNDP